MPEGDYLAVQKVAVVRQRKGEDVDMAGSSGSAGKPARTFHISGRNLGDSLRTIDNRKSDKVVSEVKIPWKIRTRPMKFAKIPKKYGAKPVLTTEMEDKAVDEQRTGLFSAGSRLRTFKMGVPLWVKAGAYMQEYTNERVSATLQGMQEKQQHHQQHQQQRPQLQPIELSSPPQHQPAGHVLVGVALDYPLVDPGSSVHGGSCTDSISFAEDYVKSLDRGNTHKNKTRGGSAAQSSPMTPLEMSGSLRDDSPSKNLADLLTFSPTASHKKGKRQQGSRGKSSAASSLSGDKPSEPQDRLEIRDQDRVSLDRFNLLEPMPSSAHSNDGTGEPMYSPDKALKQEKEKKGSIFTRRKKVTETNDASAGSSVVGDEFATESRKLVRSPSLRSYREGALPDFEDFFEDDKSSLNPARVIADRDYVFMDERGEIREYTTSSREWSENKMTNLATHSVSDVSSMGGVSQDELSQGGMADVMLMMNVGTQPTNPNPHANTGAAPHANFMARISNLTRRMDEMKRHDILQRAAARSLDKQRLANPHLDSAPVLRVATAPLWEAPPKTSRWPKILTPAQLEEAAAAVAAAAAVGIEGQEGLFNPAVDGNVMPLSDILDDRDDVQVFANPESQETNETKDDNKAAAAALGKDTPADELDKAKTFRRSTSTPALYKTNNREMMGDIMYEYYPDYSEPTCGSQEAAGLGIPRMMEVHGGKTVVVLDNSDT